MPRTSVHKKDTSVHKKDTSAQMRKFNKRKAEFVRIASHQLRTPLTTISWYVEMLRSGDAGKLNEDQKAYLKEVSTSVGYMADRINALLDAVPANRGCMVIGAPDAKSRTTVCVKRK